MQIRVNDVPVADAGEDRSAKLPVVLEAGGSDPDGDALSVFHWRVISPACANCFDDPTARVAQFTPPAPGVYTVGLIVGDGALMSLEDVVVLTVTAANRAPVLVLNKTSLAADSGASFADLNAAGSFDPDGDPITITWTKVSGDASYAGSYSGITFGLTAPPFAGLAHTTATYAVVASDGTLQSDPQTVSVYTAPGPDYVLVSSRPGAVDTAACGGVSLPCKSVAFALTQSAGRPIVVTSGLINDTAVITWQPGVDVSGGRDPNTFEPGGTTTWQIVFSDAFLNPPQGTNAIEFVDALQVTLRDLDISYTITANADRKHAVLYISNSHVTLDNVSVHSNFALGFNVGIAVYGAGAELTFTQSRIDGGGANRTNRGIDLDSGGIAHVQRSTLAQSSNTTDTGTKQCVICVRGSTVEIEASKLSMSGGGGYTEVGTGVISADNAVVSINNSALVNNESPDHSLISHSGSGALSVSHTTLLGLGPSAANGSAGVSAEVVSKVWNSLFKELPIGLNARTDASNGSLLYGNVFDSVTRLAVCNNAPAVTGITEFNTTGCNGVASFGGNHVGTCPLLADQLHLNSGVANACIDAAMQSSPAGVAATGDVDGQMRVMPDVGPDEI